VSSKGFQQFKTLLRPFGMVFAMLIIWFYFNHVTEGAFLEPRNLSNLLRQMAVTGILASGMVLIMVAGHIDLSVGAISAFLGGILAVVAQKYPDSPMLAVGAALATGLLIGLIQGGLTSYFSVPSFIVTLGGMMSFRGASMWITSNSTIPLQESWISGVGTAHLPASWGWLIVVLGLILTISFRIREWWKQSRIRKDA